ncbi:phosphatidate cytidylyltransferase [Helicobacter didelphidarum]|uniref:Phosphatidate cytidylyltransferase n=1 Tax=Helicobacter didelphidarum TaxID=2040648 RepID=A0A3D8IQP4_9HELI|nr:phosphatidate cytidylyltransferase [Helicobacter didelphidarum]RDU67608.1 phosphatidate cytidylyltransferase [Helicobacter didelphidarum]
MLKKFKAFIMQDSQRVWSALVMIVVLGVVFWINNRELTWASMGVLYLIAMYEATKLYQINLHTFSIILAVVLWVALYFSTKQAHMVVATLGLCAASIYAIRDNSDSGFKLIAPFIYPSLPFVSLYSLYCLGVGYLVWLIIVVAIADIFAYYGGKKLGRTPLCAMSPKKTIEGALCGIVGGVIAGSVAGIGIFGTFPIAAISSVFIIICSIIGDLFESALKRRANLKDSGTILPGHGGILDRIDAILFGSVAMLFILSLLTMYHP